MFICSSVYASKIYMYLQYSLFSGNNLGCGLERTCCMEQAEKNLLSSSEKTRMGLTNPLHKLKDMFQFKRRAFKGISFLLLSIHFKFYVDFLETFITATVMHYKFLFDFSARKFCFFLFLLLIHAVINIFIFFCNRNLLLHMLFFVFHFFFE